jgi:spore germination cell wall hydrolase CwlJ-like protein
VAIARIAQERLANEVAPNVLWYHADYVAPVWRHNLRRVTKIGAHIFYS